MSQARKAAKGEVRLRPLGLHDEAAFLDGHRRMMEKDGWHFALNYEEGMVWSEYVKLLQDMSKGINMPQGLVPNSFLAVVVDGVIVGRVSIRHRLNEWLARQGGHIGYGILPEHRRKGYATEVLRQALVVARSLGIHRVLVCCDDDNAGSIGVIESCGGDLQSVIVVDSGRLRRYWFS